MHRWLNSRPAAWLAVVLWMGVIFTLSAQSTLPRLIAAPPGLVNTLGHLAEYTVLGALMLKALRVSGARRPVLLTIVFCGLFGASDEFHQSFVPGRATELYDLMVDLCGAWLSVELVRVFGGIFSPAGHQAGPSVSEQQAAIVAEDGRAGRHLPH